MNVLSLFDGISCGQVALKRCGLEYDNYFSSEVGRWAIAITQYNYPNTVQIGDVCKVSFKNGVLHTENGGFDIDHIDLVMGGSPCQGFSFAGKQLNFKDPRSSLFFEFVRLLEECRPKWFLLENVMMNKKCQNVISGLLGVSPILINSAKVSAQNRRRLYWTNIPFDRHIKDKRILLRDILKWDGKDVTDDFRKLKKWSCNWRHAIQNMRNLNDKAKALTISWFGLDGDGTTNVVMRNGKIYNLSSVERERLQTLPDNYTEYGIMDDRDMSRRKGQKRWGNHFGTVHTKKSPMLCAIGKSDVLVLEDLKRQLSIEECELLQTLPEKYTLLGLVNKEIVRIFNRQRYKCLGNGWTVDVIAHIFQGMKTGKTIDIRKPIKIKRFL